MMQAPGEANAGPGQQRRGTTCFARCSHRLPFGIGIVMERAKPLPQNERDHLMDTDSFPDWDYVPPDEEYKASDWGRLSDGRLVALDYSTPALD
jgi:hypothetical protein